MHQQAILVTANAKLGSAGTPVGIDDIEKHFATTTAANAGIAYKCADPKCGVPVIAVITKLTKATRKTSPSSYFRANGSKPHVNGCTREPSPSVPTKASHSGQVNTANPNRTNAPVVWVDPLSQAGSTSGVGGSVSATGSMGSDSIDKHPEPVSLDSTLLHQGLFQYVSPFSFSLISRPLPALPVISLLAIIGA
jgi:hypothetical protein